MKKVFTLIIASMMVSAAMAWDALYIVGGGTKQAGWGDGERIPMVKISETEFEYSGYFYKTNGEDGSEQGWKIVSSGDSNDWSCTQYQPKNGWAECARGVEVEMKSDGGEDNKFWVDASGFYTINIKTDVNKVTISNSDKPKYLIPVGDCCENGWDNRGNQLLKETDEGSGKYTGTLTLTPSNGHWMKFLCQPLYSSAYVGTKSDADGEHDIKGLGVFDAKSYIEGVDGDHKYYVLDEAAGTYNMTVDINDGKVYIVPQEITIKANVTKEAVAALGSVKCFAWTGIGSEAKDMTLEDGFYTATFSTHMPLSFLIYNGKFKNDEGGVQTVDMSNSDNGYYEDKCVNVISRRTNDNKLMCFHNDDCQLNSNSVTVNIYVEDAGWEDVYFFTQNVGDQSEYQNVFVHPTKGADNWYSYTYEGVDNLKWVATATTDNWNTQVNDVENLSGEKYLYVLADKHENGHHKMADMVGKTLPQTLTYAFKFDGTAHTSWGNENPVVLRSWQYYNEDCLGAADHVKYIPMEKDADGVYSATLKAFNNVKMCLQSTDYGYQEDGSHWTVPTENNEEEVGFAESKKFWIKDNGSAHYLALTENFDFVPAVMSVTLNEKGFASFYWDRTCKIVGADAYIGKLVDDAVVLMKINGNGILQSKTAVILYGEPNTEVFMTETLDAGIGLNPYDNALTGTLVEFTPTGIFYALAEYEGETGFVKIDNGTYHLAVPANRAYLPIGSAAGAPRLRIRFAENTATDNANANINVNVKKVLRDGQLYIVRDGRMYNVLGK